MNFPLDFIGVDTRMAQLWFPTLAPLNGTYSGLFPVIPKKKFQISELLCRRYSHQLLCMNTLCISSNWFFIPKVERIESIAIPILRLEWYCPDLTASGKPSCIS